MHVDFNAVKGAIFLLQIGNAEVTAGQQKVLEDVQNVVCVLDAPPLPLQGLGNWDRRRGMVFNGTGWAYDSDRSGLAEWRPRDPHHGLMQVTLPPGLVDAVISTSGARNHRVKRRTFKISSAPIFHD